MWWCSTQSWNIKTAYKLFIELFLTIKIKHKTNEQCWEHCRLKVNNSMWRDVMRLHPFQGNEVNQNSFGHSKVVLPSGIVGTLLPRWDVPVDVHHYTESNLSLLSVIMLWKHSNSVICNWHFYCFYYPIAM